MSLVVIIVIIVLFGIAVSVMLKDNGYIEAISQGALMQLYAKGPMDTHLTADAWKYIPPWFSYDYYWPTYFDYNYRRGALFAPTRRGMMNYYYYRPYGLRRY